MSSGSAVPFDRVDNTLGFVPSQARNLSCVQNRFFFVQISEEVGGWCQSSLRSAKCQNR
jgi:hypothetical protein